MKHRITQAITPNKDLTIEHSEAKSRIEKAGYGYFEFTPESIKSIASAEDIEKIPDRDLRSIVQALFPERLICNGLFDGILLFEVRDGKRVDPPEHFYGGVNSYLDNDDISKVNMLKDEIKDLFLKNGISPSHDWCLYFDGERRKSE